MAKIDITKTELVWPGKYNEDGTLKEAPRVSLPFQVIETVNESRATREAQKATTLGLFDVYEGKEGDTFEDGWRNKLIWGDNLLVMGSLLEKFAGKIDFIYIDPPFATGADFSFTTLVGDKELEVLKEQSAIEEKAYRDTWGQGLTSYAPMMWNRLRLMKDLLAPKGTIAVHVDWRVGYMMKAMLDELFGGDSFINEIIWSYTGAGASPERFSRRHDNIYWYANGADWFFDPDPLRTEYADATKERFSHHIGNVRGGRDFGVQELNPKGKHPDDVVRVSIEAPSANERTGYATQKPIALLQKLVAGLAPPNGLVADFFVGSGTTLKACELTGRRWIGCDLGRWGIHVTRKRLLGIENCKPFEVLNLGRYERQYWQGVTFGEMKTRSLTEQAFYEYLAFILRLYGAQPVAGMAHLHGKKSKAMIHIGAVDAPVTISEIDAAVDECVKLRQGELHVLGWEWEMGLYDLMVEAAKKKSVKLLLLQIPREVMEQQAAAKGDVRFFELAYLEAEVKQPKKLVAQVLLKDFVIPNTELIPEDVRSKVKKWSDYIDYWAVDWDFRSDTFMQGWVAYRTRKERKLPLASDAHTYEKPGKHRVLVKVIDIFGNDTSQAFDVEVK
jgi:adenine-specific DNA-methyltransferase